jgi:hypothetical protein
MGTTIITGSRKVGKGLSSRGLSRVRYVGTLKVVEDGITVYMFAGPVHRLTQKDAQEDAKTEAAHIAAQNPGVAIQIS